MSIKTLTDELDKAVTVAQGAAKALDAAKAAAAAAHATYESARPIPAPTR